MQGDRPHRNASFTFLVDRCLGRYTIPNALSALGYRVELHSDHFIDRERDDSTWLALAGARGWAVLSGDNRVRHNDIERQAVNDHLVRYFAFRSNNMSGTDQAQLLRKHDSRIREVLNRRIPPYIARITRSTVRIVFPQ